MNNNTSLICEKAKKAIEEYAMLENVKTVVVGFSGGADSVCLLHFLNSVKEEYNFRLCAAHVNHGIRGEEAERDSAFSHQFAEELSIDFHLLEVNCVKEAAENNESVEEAGRRIRYNFFNSVIENEDSVIATAHNSNDNAETIIFNISRGASLSGAKGIPPKRNNIIRPLIYCTRAEIEGYCSENNLAYVTDSTNLSDDYTRNRIRHFVIPEIEKVNQGAISAFSRFSKSVQSDVDYLNSVAEEAFKKAKTEEHSYNTGYIASLHPSIRSRVLYKAILSFSNENPDSKKIEAVAQCIKENTQIQLYKNCYAKTEKGVLKFFGNVNNKIIAPLENKQLSMDGFKETFGDYVIESEKYIDFFKKNDNLLLDNLIDCDTIYGKLILRKRVTGDKITLRRRNVTKTLKKLFLEENIPVAERDFVPVISDDNGVVWVYGIGVNKKNAVNRESKKILFVKSEKNGSRENE